MVIKKLYCYVDETGQDTKGDIFIVSVIISAQAQEEIAEFILRFILGQLGHDWEQTIMMIWEMLGEDNSLFIDKLNKEMKNFDYLGIFE